MKSLPSGYSKDLQEDKEALFDAEDTWTRSLAAVASVIDGLTPAVERSTRAASGLLLATDVADYLVARGMPFRQAHEVVGAIVRRLLKEGRAFSDLSTNEWRTHSELFDDDVRDAITPQASVAKKQTPQSTNPEAVAAALADARIWMPTLELERDAQRSAPELEVAQARARSTLSLAALERCGSIGRRRGYPRSARRSPSRRRRRRTRSRSWSSTSKNPPTSCDVAANQADTADGVGPNLRAVPPNRHAEDQVAGHRRHVAVVGELKTIGPSVGLEEVRRVSEVEFDRRRCPHPSPQSTRRSRSSARTELLKFVPAAGLFTSAEPPKFHPTNGVNVQSADALRGAATSASPHTADVTIALRRNIVTS